MAEHELGVELEDLAHLLLSHGRHQVLKVSHQDAERLKSRRITSRRIKPDRTASHTIRSNRERSGRRAGRGNQNDFFLDAIYYHG